jgi:chemotaxis protein methyltransferase CheR
MELSREAHQGLADLIHRLCGLVIGHDKAYLIRHRLTPLLQREGLANFEELLHQLQTRNGARLQLAVVEAITTKETSFFRDRAFFHALQEHVLPACAATLKRSAGQRQRIRFWSAGCSTGQECYSLTMLIRDLAAENASGLHERHFTILASDISTDALEIAKAGRYSRADVARGLPPALLERHFRHRGGHWVIDEGLRRLVQFRRFDLLHPPAGLGQFDLILCRNVLIYFDDPTRRRVCRSLYRALVPGGWFALGAAESLFGGDEHFETVKLGRVLLYRKPQRGG